MPKWIEQIAPQGFAKFLNQARSRVFDLRHRVDTAEQRDLIGLTTKRDTKGANIYQPTDLSTSYEALEALEIDHSRYTFVDIGSGKGRVLLLAARYPFRRVVGIEFALELNEVAQKNVSTYRGKLNCRDISPVWADATEFEWPNGPLVVYMCNPFRASVMDSVVANLRASLAREPRECLLVAVHWSRSYFEGLSYCPVVVQKDSTLICRVLA